MFRGIWALAVLWAAYFPAELMAKPPPFLTCPFKVVLLSANDGEMRFLHTDKGIRQAPVKDSITVIRLGPNHPPTARTVFGTVPVTIHGSPHCAISSNGRYGFVTNHSWRPVPGPPGEQPLPREHLPNVLTVIDLQADDLRVLDQVKLPAAPWLEIICRPDGGEPYRGI